MPLSSAIQEYVDRSIITLLQAINLSFGQHIPFVQAYVDQNLITLDRALQLDYSQTENLKAPHVRELIDAGTITFDTALGLDYDRRNALANHDIRQRVAAETLNLDLVHIPFVQAYVDQNLITLDRALQLDYSQTENLKAPHVKELIDADTITFDTALGLDFDRRNALANQDIRRRVTAETLNLGLVHIPFVQAYVDQNLITLDRALQLDYSQTENLKAPHVRELIADGIITVDQALLFDSDQRTALEDAETRQRLRDGDLTIEDIMGGPVHHHAHGAAAVVPNINDGQSTHNASVHKAVSESANRLADRYQLMIDGAGLESLISIVQEYVGSLSDNSQKDKAAKQCVLRITAPDYTFTDQGSQITTRQLLALTFLAISDRGNRVGSLEDARAQFIEGLYEIQRGYNLSDTGVDDQGDKDRSICSAGTFNKLIEKLQGIHPDCQILFITKATASLKLPIVVREEAMRYMSSLASPSTAEELRAFTRLISQVKEDGVEVIWDQIKGNVANRMFDEFSSLYRDRADHSFTGLIEAGQYTELPDLSIFQEQVQNSKGYHQFCSQMLRQSGMFCSHETSAEYLSEHRHDSQEAQREYDQQFGLALRNP